MDRSTFEFAHQHSESWIIGGHFKADKCVASGKNCNLHLRGAGTHSRTDWTLPLKSLQRWQQEDPTMVYHACLIAQRQKAGGTDR